jgi:hypothetical protein
MRSSAPGGTWSSSSRKDTDVPYLPMGRRETSRNAALAFKPKARGLRLLVLEAIRASGSAGLTDRDLLRLFADYSPNSIRPRRIDLVRQEKVVDSGRVRDKSIVWVAK